VSERHQGLGLGRQLLAAAIAGFRELGGRELFLESSRKLTPALKLYASMGFEMQPGIKPGSHYSRADVYMIWRDPLLAGQAARP
jgi:ribosomal protein S18 acetylase RimI-like enzyme